MEIAIRLRKGAWAPEEDDLLKKCVEKYGEGNWHQVPLRSGLKRCRKSCRLRWLNYLRPNINREKFAMDEVDLIVRLHKLLGNRWSLIAGRLPGRTSNDVKNYFNTRLIKKVISRRKMAKQKPEKLVKVKTIKPRPHTFSKSFAWSMEKSKTLENNQLRQHNDTLCKPRPTLPQPTDSGGGAWWESLLEGKDSGTTTSISELKSELDTYLWGKDIVPEFPTVEAAAATESMDEQSDKCLNDLYYDLDKFWEHLNVDLGSNFMY